MATEQSLENVHAIIMLERVHRRREACVPLKGLLGGGRNGKPYAWQALVLEFSYFHGTCSLPWS